MDKKRIGVVIPVLNGFEDAMVALNRIRTRHIWTPYIGPQWEKNYSISKVWNDQSHRAFSDGCEYVLIINDDSWLFPDTIDMLIHYMQLVDILLLSATNTQQDKFERREKGPAGLDFSCFMIKEETFDTVGLFDENFYPAYAEDNDYHYRMKLLGLQAYALSSALFYHKDNGSNTKKKLVQEGKWRDEDFRNCIGYFTRKWGGPPHSERFTHPYNDESLSVKDWIKQ